MNRGEMRSEVEHLLEAEGGKFDPAKIDRALQRSANHIHNLMTRRSSTIFARGSFEFATTMGTLEYELTDLNDMKNPAYGEMVATTASSFRSLYPTRLNACNNKIVIIPEKRIHQDQFRRTGIDGRGRRVAYLKHATNKASSVQVLTITGTPTSGYFVLSYGDEDVQVNYNATAADILASLNSMSSIGYGNITSVTLTSTGVFRILFGGDLRYKTVDLIGVDDGTLDTGTVSIEEVVAPTSVWSLVFLADPGVNTCRIVYEQYCRSIPPGVTGANGDELSYDTIPEEWHQLVCLRAAISVAGLHSESQSNLIEEHNVAHEELLNVIERGNSFGSVQQSD